MLRPPLGSFAFFVGLWVAMMAAMMLPGAAPAVARAARAGGARAVPLFAGSYLAVWALAGAVVFAIYRPHGPAVAGAVTIAAGLYEFTPLKRHFRRRCHESARSGLGFGLCCLGATAGLTACHTSTKGVPVTSTWGCATSSASRLSLVPGTRWRCRHCGH